MINKSIIFVSFILLLLSCANHKDNSRLEKLQVISGDYPKAFYFRLSEDLARANRLPYEIWEKTFLPLGGVIGKALDEEIAGTKANSSIIEYYTRFKKRHPEQLVLLHYNNGGCDPRAGENFFAGHWVYYDGCRMTADVPAEAGETDIFIEDTELFRTDVGRGIHKHSALDKGPKVALADDIGLCMLDADGKPDWSQCEQVQLLSINAERKTIRVRRGCYGTKPLAFPAGRSYAAAHATEGPYGEVTNIDGGDQHVMQHPSVRPHKASLCNLMWAFNFSTRCPRDAQGRQCSDALADNLAAELLPGGRLELFDGVEFDVPAETFSRTLAAVYSMKNKGKRQGDLDADGHGDNGIFDGIDTRLMGLYYFYEQLRQKLGEDYLIMADSHNNSQQCYGVLNGVEVEGFGSSLSKSVARGWSEGMNRFRAWKQFGRAPVFSFINHKEFKGSWDKVPYSYHRYVMATSIMCDATMTHYASVTPEPGELYGVLDELQKGTEHEYGWLGQPKGEAIRLASHTPALLGNIQGQHAAELLQQIVPTNKTKLTVEEGNLLLSGTNQKVGFRLQDIPVPAKGSDLVVLIRYKGQPIRTLPENRPREMDITLKNDTTKNRIGVITGYLPSDWFEAEFFFSTVAGGNKNLEFNFRGTEPVWIEGIQIYAHPDVMIREFDKGLVLVNPSDHPYTFDLEKLLPGKHYRRLNGSSQQDTQANNGARVDGSVTLGPRDGLFLVKEKLL